MVERQRRDDDVTLVTKKRLHPRSCLQQVGDNVPMQQHRALGNARGASGVLQKRDVFMSDRYRLELAPAPFRKCIGEPCCRWNLPCRNHFLDVAQHEVDEHAFQAEHFADRGDDDVLDLRFGEHVRKRMREVFDHDDHLGAAVVELMLELSRRVKRIDIDDGTSHPEDAEQAYRILQDVGHHQRDARSLGQATCLHESAKRRR